MDGSAQFRPDAGSRSRSPSIFSRRRSSEASVYYTDERTPLIDDTDSIHSGLHPGVIPEQYAMSRLVPHITKLSEKLFSEQKDNSMEALFDQFKLAKRYIGDGGSVTIAGQIYALTLNPLTQSIEIVNSTPAIDLQRYQDQLNSEFSQFLNQDIISNLQLEIKQFIQSNNSFIEPDQLDQLEPVLVDLVNSLRSWSHQLTRYNKELNKLSDADLYSFQSDDDTVNVYLKFKWSVATYQHFISKLMGSSETETYQVQINALEQLQRLNQSSLAEGRGALKLKSFETLANENLLHHLQLKPKMPANHLSFAFKDQSMKEKLQVRHSGVLQVSDLANCLLPGAKLDGFETVLEPSSNLIQNGRERLNAVSYNEMGDYLKVIQDSTLFCNSKVSAAILEEARTRSFGRYDESIHDLLAQYISNTGSLSTALVELKTLKKEAVSLSLQALRHKLNASKPIEKCSLYYRLLTDACSQDSATSEYMTLNEQHQLQRILKTIQGKLLLDYYDNEFQSNPFTFKTFFGSETPVVDVGLDWKSFTKEIKRALEKTPQFVGLKPLLKSRSNKRWRNGVDFGLDGSNAVTSSLSIASKYASALSSTPAASVFSIFNLVLGLVNSGMLVKDIRRQEKSVQVYSKTINDLSSDDPHVLRFQKPKLTYRESIFGTKKVKSYERDFLHKLQGLKKAIHDDILNATKEWSKWSEQQRSQFKIAIVKRQLIILQNEKQLRAYQNARRYRKRIKYAIGSVLGAALLTAGTFATGGALGLVIAGSAISVGAVGGNIFHKRNFNKHKDSLIKESESSETKFTKSLHSVNSISYFMHSNFKDFSDYQFLKYADLMAQGASPSCLSAMIRSVLSDSPSQETRAQFDLFLKCSFSHKGQSVSIADLQNEHLAKRYVKTY